MTPLAQVPANAMTVDVEDYFQVSALAPHIPRSQWAHIPCRVERNVDRLLELFDGAAVHATFFTLGWVAERYPAMVRRIVAAGHELASHGYAHLRASEQTPQAFAADIVLARSILEDVGSVPVIGYRAPSFSIGEANLWALDAIAEAGYRYSSSIYPVRHDHYGMPGSPRAPYLIRPGLTEFPVSTVAAFGRTYPAGGGGFFRLLPYAVSRSLLRQVNREGQPAIFYFHPWEIDPDQPRVSGLPGKTRFRHYLNLDRTLPRLTRLVRDFRWAPAARVLADAGALDQPFAHH